MDSFIYYLYIEGDNYHKLFFFIANWESQKNNGWLKLNLIKTDTLNNGSNIVYNYNIGEKIYTGR